MNFVWPNVFEVSPHVINAVTEAVEGFLFLFIILGMRVSIGAGAVLMYVL
jgi:splicing factor 3B subunit 1